MSITQRFYDALAPHYDKLFLDWEETVREQAGLLDGIFKKYGLSRAASVLDCACGIGTQAIGLALAGYAVCASDLSEGALAEARRRAEAMGAAICCKNADFRALGEAFSERFDAVIAMDNALPHMLTAEDLRAAVASVAARVRERGVFVGSIRDYDALLQTKPPYSPPYIHKTEGGRRVSFQTWCWQGDRYRLTQYIIDDEGALGVNKFECEYRATKREELTALLLDAGFAAVDWLFPEESGFYQPIFVARA